MGKRKNKKKRNKINKSGGAVSQQQVCQTDTSVQEGVKAAEEKTEPEKEDARAAKEKTEPEKEDARAAEEKTEPEKDDARAAEEKTEPEKEDARVAEEKTEPEKEDVKTAGKKLAHIWVKRGAGAAALVLFGIYLGGIAYFNGKFLANTTINGIDISFCTVEEAEKKIKAQVEDYTIVLKQRDDLEETISAEEIGYHYVSNGETERFLKSQKLAFWFTSYFHPAVYEFDAASAYDQERLEAKVNHLKCFDEEYKEAPSNARMVFEGTRFEIRKERQGKEVRPRKLMKVLKEAIASNREAIDLDEEKCYKVPSVTSEDKVLNRLVNNMNHYADIEITYCFGDKKEVLGGRVIRDWLVHDEDGTVYVRDGAISSYVEKLAEKYDTYDRPREFKTTDGSYVTVKGGSYGWKIDQELEAAWLTEQMELETVTERIPEFAQTGDGWSNSDLGESYVEVDLTKQHLWMYKDGELVVDSDFVSGTMNRQRMTPPGTYRVYYKKSPAVLKGEGYESPVTFWMPFNGGVGLHDSNWRGSYGGDIYWYSGSHGCINLPYQAAKTIYENIYTGYPVICFYRNGEDGQI